MRNRLPSDARKWPDVVAQHTGSAIRSLRLTHPLTAGAQSVVRMLLVAGGVGSFLVGYGLHAGVLFPPTLAQAPLSHSAQANASSGLGARVTSRGATGATQQFGAHTTRTVAVHSPVASVSAATRHTSHATAQAAPGQSGRNGKAKGHGKDKSAGQGAGHGGHRHRDHGGNGRGKGDGAHHSKGHGHAHGHAHGTSNGKTPDHQAPGKQKKPQKVSKQR